MIIYTLTFHNSCSHGALLQCYALPAYFKGQGHDARVLDYRCDAIEKGYRLFTLDNSLSLYRKMKRLLVQIISFPVNAARKYSFSRFVKRYIPLSEHSYHTAESLLQNPPECGCFLSGSDQVWNPDITGGLDPVYFLQIDAPRALKCTYAASIGKEDLSHEETQTIIRYASKLDSVTVREENVRTLLEKNGIANVRCVCDPVFLLAKEDWVAMIPDKRQVPYPYVLLYNLDYDEDMYQYAMDYAAVHSLPVIDIGITLLRKKHGEKRLFGVGPDSFMNLIYHAEYVITSSFHGVAMSIILEKQFCCFLPHMRKERIRNLMRLFNLEQHIVENPVTAGNQAKEIHYETVTPNVTEYANASKVILDEMLRVKNGDE